MRLPIVKRYSAASIVAGGPAVPTDGRILVPTNYIQFPFELSCAILASSDAAAAAGVATVLFTYDSMSNDDFVDVGVAQALTVITIIDASLPARGGIAVGDVVKLLGTGTPTSNIDGEYVVATVVSPTSYTLTSAVSQTFNAQYGGKAGTFRMFPSLIKNAAVARAFGNLSAGLAAATATGILNSGPVTGVALNISVLTAGSLYLSIVQGAGSR